VDLRKFAGEFIHPFALPLCGSLQIDPVYGRLLIEALNGRWSYEKEARRDKRNVWFHVVNAFSLLIARMAPDAPKADGKILPDKDYDYRRW
jgi:hypothetical protein